MSDSNESPSQENEVGSAIDATTPTRVQSLLQSPIFLVLLRIVRVGLFLFGVWTTYLYFWSILGIVIGILIAILPGAGAWRRHGLVLSYTSVIFAVSIAVYAWVWLLLAALFQIVYLILHTIYYGAKYLVLGVRKITKREKKPADVIKESWFRRIVLNRLQIEALTKKPTLTLRLKTLVTLVILVAPILMWSSINIDFEVMFDNSPRLLWVHAPSTVDRGDTFEVIVEAWDQFERLSANYQGTIGFSIQSYNLSTGAALAGIVVDLPDNYTFTGGIFGSGLGAFASSRSGDYGLHSFDVQINTPGIHYVLIEDSLTQNLYPSNPIIVDDYAIDSPRIYWGDVHGHSAFSDGSGSPTESYLFGRYISHLDFMSLTDHGEHFTVFDRAKAGSARFQDYLQATASANEPGEFVSLFGAEWTTGYADQALWFIPVPAADGGHYTCIFSGDSIPLLSTITENTAADLWNVLDDFTSSTGARALAIPHHTVRNQFIQDWTLMNPNYVKLVEVTSVHGECLYDNELNHRGSVDLPTTPIPGSSVIDALNMGYRMTFMANGDNHDGRPGHSISHTRASIGHQYPFTLYNARNGHPYPSGITAVYATSLTRDGVFSGLENGRVYATSDYGRPILDFSINGVSVGYNTTVSVATPTTTRNITLFFAQDGSPPAGLNQAATAGAGWVPNWGATIEIIKNGLIWQTILIDTPTGTVTISDIDAITGTSYDSCIEGEDSNSYINDRSENPVDPDTLNTGGMDYYAIRIIGANGRTSYIGPIWVYSP
ncbi:MAG: DUF3604 domain-containing protein [Candidatus Thorarchaeota archaeon]|jgi:hypothetical protein